MHQSPRPVSGSTSFWWVFGSLCALVAEGGYHWIIAPPFGPSPDRSTLLATQASRATVCVSVRNNTVLPPPVLYQATIRKPLFSTTREKSLAARYWFLARRWAIGVVDTLSRFGRCRWHGWSFLPCGWPLGHTISYRA